MRRVTFLLLLMILSLPLLAAAKKPGQPAARAGNMPVTTSSPAARRLFEKGMVAYENLHLSEAQEAWQAAVKKDPNFAQAWVYMVLNSRDPKQEAEARAKAKALASRVTPGERLLIRWIVGARENNFVDAIQAMNDLLAQYPRDPRLAQAAGGWLLGREEYAPAQHVLERCTQAHPRYAPCFNDLGYAYAYTRQFDKAFATMAAYTSLLPSEPNPEDSYAEILRLAGKFDQTLEHYRAALKIDPRFESSQVGIADTYALMGQYDQARAEYPKALEMATSPAERAQYSLQQAMLWVREKNWGEADKAFAAVGQKAHSDGLAFIEAQAWRMRATCQRHDAAAIRDLEAAKKALDEATDISQADRREEQSRILRLEAERAAKSGSKGMASSALQNLGALAQQSDSSVVRRNYEAAQGALLALDGKYAEAIPHLQEDGHNAFSAERLVLCYQKTGAADQARELADWLVGLNEPTLEQALVVPAFRARGK